MITRSGRRSRGIMDTITTIVHQVASFMIGPEYESWDHTLQTTYNTHLELHHEGTHVPYHIQYNSTRAWLGWIHRRSSHILRDTNMIILAIPFVRRHIQSFRSHFSSLINRYRLYSYDDMAGTHHRIDGGYGILTQPASPRSQDTFTIRFYTINCHTDTIMHSVPAIIQRQDVTFQTARRVDVPGANTIQTHDEHGQPWANGYYPNGAPHPDSPHRNMDQPPITPTPPTPSVPADAYSFPISLRTLKQINRLRVQHILEEYMWGPHYPPTSYGLEISDCQNLGHVFTAIVNEQHEIGPRSQRDATTVPYTRIVFRTARARRGYTQPLLSSADAAADVYITFPTFHHPPHTQMWDSLSRVARRITYAPQYHYDRHVEVLIQLRHNDTNVES